MTDKFNIENGVLTGVVDKNIEVAVIPNTVKVIGKSAFFKCTSLKEVIIPDSVSSIGYNAFGGCTSLKSVEIPNSVYEIGHHAFYGCTSLERAVISAGIIGESAFTRCPSLESVEMLDGVVKIEEEAFYMCDSLKSVSFPISLKVIEKKAFERCKNLESVDFSLASLDLIGEYAFRCCEKLEGLKVIAKEVGELAFGNTGIKDLLLVSKSVSKSAFAYCCSLETAKVYTEYLGQGAFEGCNNIKFVELKGINTEYDSVYDIDGDEIEGGYVHVAGEDIIRYAFVRSNGTYIVNRSKDKVDNVIVYGKKAS